ncbi:MAG: asparagine synthase (glutamine-hydrolyzing) [Alphaproteobacteria bacterium]|nr:asparagine synthase (glutamine-hydrolyzing) [Alphaproteobacteria bacterium]
MCGIAGFIGRGGADDIRRMTAKLIHRGPDGEGYFADQHLPVFLGNRRLAVIDPAAGQQPMWDATGDLCVVYNGEIYNHRELRRELEAAGCRFRTDHSDTEVLLHGYKTWDTELFPRLNGMFAVALYDRHRKSLVMARDRFGEKPLFFSVAGGGFVFASELPALLAHPIHRAAQLSNQGVRKFFAHGFFPAHHTPYRDIEKFPAGEVWKVSAVDRSTIRRAYWRFSIEPDAAPPGKPDDWAAELGQRLSRAVKGRLDSDVPLGIFLSGGVDSGTVASFAADHRPAASIKTFSIGFREESFDESEFAAAVSRHIGTTHHVETCELESLRDMVPEILADLGEPIGDSSILPTALLSAFARKHVTVALTGDGGDELFAGYDPFRMLKRAAWYQRHVPKPLHAAIKMIAARLPASDDNMSFDFVMGRGLKGLAAPPALWNPLWLAPLQPDEISELMKTPVSAEDLYSEAIDAWDHAKSPHLIDRVLEFYTRFYLADGILVKSDRASMRVSLEARTPFLDNEVVDFARRLPWSVKLKGGTNKWILKRAVRTRLPRAIVRRPKKGFGIPLARWLRQMPMPRWGLLGDVDDAPLAARWRSHQNRKSDERLALWSWMALAHGLQRSPAAP